MTLNDTVQLMLSDDYKDRMRAEYWQTKIRYERLHRMIIKIHAGTIQFTPKCHVIELEAQAKSMGEYLRELEIRSEIEGVDFGLDE